jgi:hypothetical protein
MMVCWREKWFDWKQDLVWERVVEHGFLIFKIKGTSLSIILEIISKYEHHSFVRTRFYQILSKYHVLGLKIQFVTSLHWFFQKVPNKKLEFVRWTPGHKKLSGHDLNVMQCSIWPKKQDHTLKKHVTILDFCKTHHTNFLTSKKFKLCLNLLFFV